MTHWDITVRWRMARWDAQAEERLRTAAIELFLELGYENVTVAQIADRAGLTRRTFSRYFTDKRDVLFAGSERLPGLLAEALSRADPELTPFEALLTALADVGAVLGDQVALHAAQRREVIARSPELQERGRTKFADVADALAAELVREAASRRAPRCSRTSGSRSFELASTDGSTTPIVTTWPLACARPAPSSSTPSRHSATADQPRRPSPCCSGIDRNCVSIGVSEHEGPAKWTMEGLGGDAHPGMNKPIVQGSGVIGLEPQCDAPAETLDRLQVNGWLTHGKGNRSGGKDDCSWWALGCLSKTRYSVSNAAAASRSLTCSAMKSGPMTLTCAPYSYQAT